MMMNDANKVAVYLHFGIYNNNFERWFLMNAVYILVIQFVFICFYFTSRIEFILRVYDVVFIFHKTADGRVCA